MADKQPRNSKPGPAQTDGTSSGRRGKPSGKKSGAKPQFNNPPGGKPGSKKPAGNLGGGGRSAAFVRVRKLAELGVWELVHPRCACDRSEDVEEVRKMIEADELDVAVDELRWLLSGCSDFIDAHKALGELALLDGDIPLARGHFGYAFRIGSKALEQAGVRGNLPYSREANQTFHESGKGLAFCLKRLEKLDMLQEVVDLMLACDPSDPLGVRGFLSGPAEPRPTGE